MQRAGLWSSPAVTLPHDNKRLKLEHASMKMTWHIVYMVMTVLTVAIPVSSDSQLGHIPYIYI